MDKEKVDSVLEHLNRAQNPIFYYDNDCDGLCSFLLLRRLIGRGVGIPIRSYPELDESYAGHAERNNADYVFILDKPVLNRKFIESIHKLGIPIVWIDHHSMQGEDFSLYPGFFMYKGDEPVSSMCYSITRRKEDIWIALIGCISDHYLPKWVDEFEKEYGEYWKKEIKKPFDALYGTELGVIARALNLGLKDSITNVKKMQEHLTLCKNPGEVLGEIETNKEFRKTYEKHKKKYLQLIKEGEEEKKGKLLFFSYSGETSMSSDIANELSYRNPGVFIAVAFLKGGITNISLRGRNVKRILENIIEKLGNASGGGHEDAVGARIRTEDLRRFEEMLKEEIK